MKDIKILAQVVWECKYHLVWCPKYCFMILKGEIGRTVRDIIKQLCECEKVVILEGNIQVDHIHLVLSFPPKYSISEVVGFVKGKSGAQRGASVVGSESLSKENSASCILDRVLGLQR